MRKANKKKGLKEAIRDGYTITWSSTTTSGRKNSYI
jgi:hypothetical protein